MADRSGATRPLTGGMRAMLFVAAALVFAVGVSLFILTEQTDRYFAWTIKSPLTAAFLGASYWSACVLELMAGRERRWSHARVAVPAVVLFTGLTLVVTLAHLDKFHFAAPEALTRAGTWFWLAVYAFVPVAMGGLLALQLRAPGGDPPREAPMPGLMVALLWVIGGSLVAFGVALLLAPAAAGALWPWALTPLTARALGAWLVGLGVAAAHSGREADTLRARPVLVSTVIFCLLQLIALARYSGEVAWAGAPAWVLLAYLVLMMVVAVFGLLSPGRAAPGPQLAGG